MTGPVYQRRAFSLCCDCEQTGLYICRQTLCRQLICSQGEFANEYGDPVAALTI
jgi:hypothetical protein